MISEVNEPVSSRFSSHLHEAEPRAADSLGSFSSFSIFQLHDRSSTLENLLSRANMRALRAGEIFTAARDTTRQRAEARFP
jgi:hypothetical protein